MPTCTTDKDALLGPTRTVQPEQRIALNKRDAAAAVGMSVDTFDRHVAAGTFTPRKPGGRGHLVLFRVDELLDALVAMPTAGNLARGLVSV